MSGERLLSLSVGWPVLLVAGIALGIVTLHAAERRANLLWFFPVLLAAAIAYVLLTGGAPSVPFWASEQLGIGVVALVPAGALAFVVAWYALEFRAPPWLLVGGPLVACLLSSPAVGYVGFLAICELTGECY